MPDLNHVALAVEDPWRALRFYRDVVGVDGVVHEEEYGYVITTPAGLAFTLLRGRPPTAGGEFHLGVLLANGDAVRAKRKHLASLGIAELEWWDEPGYVSVKVADPDGYTVEIAWDEKYPG